MLGGLVHAAGELEGQGGEVVSSLLASLPALDDLVGLAAPGAAESKAGVPLRDALIQQLGLDLRPDRSLIDFLVIESIARPTPD